MNSTTTSMTAAMDADLVAAPNMTGNDSVMLPLPPDAVSEIINEFIRRQHVYSEPAHIFVIACYLPLFLVALFANCLVIFVVFKYHYMRSVTNYFLVNLSIADLLVTLICMPMAVGQNVTKLWIYGEGMCMLHAYFQGVSVSASIFTITAMSIDRYLAIRHPMAFRKVFNRKSTIVVIIALWVVSTLLFAPLLWVQRTQEPAGLTDMLPANNALDNGGLKICIEDWDRTPFSKKVYGVFLFTLVYAIPGTVVMVAYTLMGRRLCAVKPPFDENSTAGSASSQQGSRLVRERRRVARILLVLAVLFAMCWLPYNVNILVIDLLEPEDSTMPMHALTRVLTRWEPFFLLLGHCNSAINPLLYCFMTRNFRRTVRGLFTRRRARPLGTRPQQRCKIRACPRTASATSSSGYDSYHSPHRRCYVLKLHTLRDSRATAESGSAASASYPAGSGSSTRLTRLHHHCHHHLAPQQLQQTTTSMEQRYL